MERPALKQVQIVVVYKVDRLTSLAVETMKQA
jgi:hypothetical protein